MDEFDAMKARARETCARDSGWCDGTICRDHGIGCPNAEPWPDPGPATPAPLLPELGSIYGRGGPGRFGR